MANPKPLASLSSGLLARPGAAKPAMRPQLFAQTEVEDLGWNDMGHVAPVVVPPVLAERAKLASASAVAGRSSQQLLIEALDTFLNSQPEVEALARQVPADPQPRPSREN